MLKLLRWFCLFFLPFVSLAQMPSDFKLEKTLSTPIGFPYDVGVDTQGNMYVLESGIINKFDAQGTLLQQLDVSSPDPAKPNASGYGMALDAAGNVYVADFGYAEVRKFNPEGRLLLAFGTGSYPATGSGNLPNPTNLSVDAAGNVYVVGDSPAGMHKFNAQGKLQWAFVAPGNNLGQSVTPKDVAVDAAGQVFVLESDHSICQVGEAGELVRQLIPPGAGGRTDTDAMLAVDPAGNFYTSLSQGGITKYGAQGQFLNAITSDPYSFNASTRTALATDAAGNLYATTRDHHGDSKLYKFDPAGNRLNKWGNVAYYRFPVQDRAGNFMVFDGQQIIKRDAAGRQLLRFGSNGVGTPVGSGLWSVLGIAADPAGNIYALEVSGSTGQVRKFSPAGQVLAVIKGPDVPLPDSFSNEQVGFAVDPASNFYVCSFYGSFVRKFDPQGRKLLQFGVRGAEPGQLQLPRALAVDGRGFVYVADMNGHRVQKFTPTGRFVLESKLLPPYDDMTWVCTAGLSVDAAGTMYVSSSLEDYIKAYDPSGRMLRKLPIYSTSFCLNPQGTRLLTTSGDVVRIYGATTLPRHRSGQITGRIFQDQDFACAAQVAPALPETVVVAEPGNYYGFSDEQGNYTIEADTGRYTVRQLLPDEPGRNIHQTCVTQPTVHLAAYDTTVPGPAFGDQVTLAPYLSIRVASSRRRRCFRNTTSISYANTGFAAAPGAKVTLKLPQYVVLISANAPYTRDAQGNYLFAVGDLAPQQRGQITVLDSVVCGNEAIRGLTVCTKAWITPGNTYPPPTAWNGGSVAVRGGQTTASQVRFALVNKSQKAIGDSLGLRLYTDARLALNKKYTLAAGDSLILRVPAAAGQALRLEADQPANYPLGALTSATVQAGTPANGQPNPAFMMLPPTATAPTEAEDCQPIRDSYDPNDKQVLPTGTGPEHYTPTGAALSYQIRFQNTGTDAAYRVEVVDTLSAYLDLSTLRVGAASHPYRLRVSGKGRPVLTFTFDGIDLPEKARSDAGSQGFIQFSIAPKAGLGAKAKIENQAAIYFDFNDPVLTNATINRIFDVPPVVAPADALALASLIVSPQLTSFSPVQGRAGTLVLISGQHFNPQADANQVSFNGVPAPVLSSTTSTLTVRVPVGTASGQIRVLTADGGARSSTNFVVFQPPTLTTTSADDTTPGATLRLTGTGFSAVAAQDTVTFGEAPAVVLAATTTELTVQVPAKAPEMSEVRVATLGGTATLARLVRIWQKPVVSTLAPAKGKTGDLLTLTGLNFAETAGRSEVRLGPALAEITAATATRLTVRVPVGSQSGPVRVRTPGGEAWSAQTYTFVPAPLPLQFVPAAGSVGTEVTLSGENFNLDGQADSVYFTGAAAKVLSASPTKLRVLVPRGARSGPLLVAGAGGRTASKAGFGVLTLLPDEALALYPNPAPGGAATLDWRRAAFSVTQVRVFDSRGGLVLSYAPAAAADTLALPLAGRSPGLYLVLVQTSQGLVRKRLTVQ